MEALAETNLLTFKQVLQSKLPPLNDMSSTKSSSSLAGLRKYPRQVVHWDGFSAAVRNFIIKLPKQLLDLRPFPDLAYANMFIKDEPYECSSELALLSHFRNTAGVALTYLFNRALVIDQWSEARFRPGEPLCLPDFHCLLKKQSISYQQQYEQCQSDNPQEEFKFQTGMTYDNRDKGTVIVVGEMKCHNLLGQTDTKGDLVQAYNGGHVSDITRKKTSVVDALQQVTGYCVAFESRYAFLSTYQWTWAAKLTTEGTLMLSDGFKSSREGLGESTISMMYYVCQLAQTELSKEGVPKFLDLTDPINAKVKKRLGDELSEKVPKRKQREQDMESEADEEDLSSNVDFVRQLVFHPDRRTWQGSALGQLVVVKAYTKKEDRDWEVEAYNLLEEMQGVSIPRLLYKNYTMDHSDFPHALIIEWVGPKYGGNFMTLPTEALEKACHVLQMMHSFGVSHGDPRPQNMFYDFDIQHLFIYDFSDACIEKHVELDVFQAACDYDLQILKDYIPLSQTSEQ